MKRTFTIFDKFLMTLCFLMLCHFDALLGQCVDNSNYWIESWTSCSPSENPNQTRGTSNWLLFEFDEDQAISTTTIWNANRQGESGLGAKDVFIDVSKDGSNWLQVGTGMYNWEQGSEAIDYEGFEGPDLSSFGFIKKVLVTVVNNHDGSNCVSIAEVKFDINQDACYGIEDECGVCDGPGITTWFLDEDGDGLGDADYSQVDCTQPLGYVSNDEDPCDNGLLGWQDMEVLFYENGCIGCHGADELGGLNLTTYEGISAGGNICGSEILTGSTLVGIISIEGFMACSGEVFNRPMNDRVDGAMDEDEIAMIQEWIDAGAPYDCACPPGSMDSDFDGVCDNSDDCPSFDNALIGTPCDDGDACTINDVYQNSCDCGGEAVDDSDFDGVCDALDLAPNNPCTADGTIGMPEPTNWVASQSNDCDEDGVLIEAGDQDDFDECITDNGNSLNPACFCPNEALETGATIIKSVGVYEPTLSFGEGVPDGNTTNSIGWRDYVDFYFPYAEIGQEICFDVGFNSVEGGVKFEINELGSYSFFSNDTTLVNFEIQTFCFPTFVSGSQTVRVSRVLTGVVRVDGSTLGYCPCVESDPKKDSPACLCPGDFISGTGVLGQNGGFNNPDRADGAPDGIFGSWMNGTTDSLEYTYDEAFAVNTEICIHVAFNNSAGKVGFELNGDTYFEITNQTGSEDDEVGQDLCFLTNSEGPQHIKIKETGSGSIWVDGTFYRACSICEADSDEDNVCDDEDICPGFDDNADEDGDGIPDGCDECNGNLVNTTCDDNDPCTTNDLFDDNCNCTGTYSDLDQDGVCDVYDLCPNFDDALLGTPCDDGDECTIGETYDKNCACSGGIFQDADEDGICDAEDECDANLTGTPCDDNDPCTGQDILDTDCNCAGIFLDADGDGICDAEDDCDANLAGTACDDNDPCTGQDVLDANCNCTGTIIDSDEDGICDADDACPNFDNNLIGMPCDDGDICTIGETYDNNCGCSGGLFQDVDEDGICDAEDECDAGVAGTSCNDNNPCTTQDVYDTDCNCAGTFTDEDEDGVCDLDDICPGGDDNLDTDQDGVPDHCDACDATLSGTTCDDNDPCTAQDVWDTECNCAGTFQDQDGDGICDAEDECNGNLAGTSCDDNDPCTAQDVLDAECNCVGVFTDEDEDGVCDQDDLCPGGDDNLDTDQDGIPDHCDECNALLSGTACDDNDPCTEQDVWDSECNCEGTFMDADQDGICDAEDDCDGNLAGTTCDDNNDCTTNDIFDTNCNCTGTIQDTDEDGVCDAEDICPGGDDNLDVDEDGIPDHCDECDATLSGTPCDDNDSCTILDVLDENCNCSGTYADSDEDGICDGEDICPDGDDNIDTDEDGIPDACDDCNSTLAGTACDDDDPCTVNDILDTACNCAGTFADMDEDGVCDADDICPGGDDNVDTDQDGIPDHCDECDDAIIGSSCNDEDVCTVDDVYDEDCNCIGIFQDSDNDGVCDEEDICPGGDDNLDMDNDGIPDACDECTNVLIDIENNVFEHSGSGFANKSILVGNKMDPSFTIRNLDANTTGSQNEQYIDLIQVNYTNTEGETILYGSFNGADQDSVVVSISGNVDKLIFKLQDGLGGSPDNLEVYISNITACEFNDINTSTSIPETSQTNFKIYPNPTQGDFSVEFNTSFNTEYKISITDVFGKNHYLKPFHGNGDQMTVDMNDLNLGQGFYFVTLHQGAEKLTKKVVILNK